jgi:hypothetical protein
VDTISKLLDAYNNQSTVDVHLLNGIVYAKCRIIGNQIDMGKVVGPSHTTLELNGGQNIVLDISDIAKVI